MDIVLSIVMLAMIALIAGAIVLWWRGEQRKQAVLMLVLAGVAAMNIAIWTIPDASGEAPLGQEVE